MPSFLRNPYLWKGLLVLTAISFSVLLVFNYIIMPAYTRQHAIVHVPDVEHLPYEEAVNRLQEYGLKPIRRTVAVYNPELPTGVVLDQNPHPGVAVKPGRRVYLVVSSDSLPQVIVPDVRNLSLREARLRLENVGLEIGDIRLDSIPTPYINTVTGMDPQPGDTVAEGTPVILWISPGPGERFVTVPDVRNLPVREADSLLTFRYHLRPVHLPAEPSLFAPPGMVYDQDPEPGMRLREGSEIRLYVVEEEDQKE